MAAASNVSARRQEGVPCPAKIFARTAVPGCSSRCISLAVSQVLAESKPLDKQCFRKKETKLPSSLVKHVMLSIFHAKHGKTTTVR